MKPQSLALRLTRLRQDAITARRYNDRVILALKQIQKQIEQARADAKAQESR